MDKLIAYFNEHYTDMTLHYSTPSHYIEDLQRENIKWPTKYDDMFPYADGPDAFWSGFFSCWANDKSYIRRGSHSLHSANKLYALKVIQQDVEDQTIKDVLKAKYELMDAMGVNQHHDAVTGTGKQAVADEYAQRVFKAMEKNNQVY